MNFKTQAHRLSELSARFNLMVFLVFGLLIANVLLSGFVWKAFGRHTIEVTPYSGNPGYFKSETQVDSHYLSLMSENFIYSRLNVTPETVEANHQRLLMFADNKSYAELLRVLTREARVVRAKKISSTFDITGIETNPSKLTAHITGVLKRYVGLRALKEERLTYVLTFRYTGSRLSILNFTHMKEKDHA